MMTDTVIVPEASDASIAVGDPIVTPDVAVARPDQQQQPEPKQTAPEIVELAREMGWVPQDEYKGSASTWIDAGDFVRNTAKINKSQREKLDNLSNTVRDMAKVSERIMNDRLEQQRKELTRQFQEAVRDGDAQGAFQASNELASLRQEAAPNYADRFQAENPWFNTNPEATAYAQAIAGMEGAKGASPEQQMKAAREAVQKRFPELFPSEQARQSAPMMQSGQRTTPPKAKRYPAEAVAAAKDMVRRGMVANEGEYFKMWDQENGPSQEVRN